MDKIKNKNQLPEGQYYRTMRNRIGRCILRLDEKTEREIIEKVKNILADANKLT